VGIILGIIFAARSVWFCYASLWSAANSETQWDCLTEYSGWLMFIIHRVSNTWAVLDL